MLALLMYLVGFCLKLAFFLKVVVGLLQNKNPQYVVHINNILFYFSLMLLLVEGFL